MKDIIYKQDAIDAVYKASGIGGALKALKHMPSVQPERDIPIKPMETTDRTWGISKKQAVCPRCDYYLGHVAFLGGGKNRITYCEICGQAINWEGWDYE
jgi:hypothetical protein